MPQYKYVAKDNAGSTQTGIVEAQDNKAAIEILRKKDLVILLLEEVKGKKGLTLAALPFYKTVKIDDLVIFSRQLATMVKQVSSCQCAGYIRRADGKTLF